MEEVLKQLYDIESRSSDIKTKTDAAKKEMNSAMELKRQAFHAETEKKAQESLAQKKQELNNQIEQELKEQQESMTKALAYLDREYEQNHAKLAEQILETLIKE